MPISPYAKKKKSPFVKEDIKEKIKPKLPMSTKATPTAAAIAPKTSIDFTRNKTTGEVESVNYKGTKMSYDEYNQFREASKTGATDIGVDRATGGISETFRPAMREFIRRANVEKAVKMGKLPASVLQPFQNQMPERPTLPDMAANQAAFEAATTPQGIIENYASRQRGDISNPIVSALATIETSKKHVEAQFFDLVNIRKFGLSTTKLIAASSASTGVQEEFSKLNASIDGMIDAASTPKELDDAEAQVMKMQADVNELDSLAKGKDINDVNYFLDFGFTIHMQQIENQVITTKALQKIFDKRQAIIQSTMQVDAEMASYGMGGD